MRWNGPKSTGRDAAAIAGPTTLGAGIGAVAEGGEGAAIGAGIGAAAGVIGVLLTRGSPTVLYPESVLTYRIESPVTIATDRAPLAFRYVTADDYAGSDRRAQARPYDNYYAPPPEYHARVYAYPYPPYPPYPMYPPPAYAYPYSWGPGWGSGFGFWGPGFYGPSFGFFFGGGGHHHGGYHHH
jgi:hypothetical protein